MLGVSPRVPGLSSDIAIDRVSDGWLAGPSVLVDHTLLGSFGPAVHCPLSLPKLVKWREEKEVRGSRPRSLSPVQWGRGRVPGETRPKESISVLLWLTLTRFGLSPGLLPPLGESLIPLTRFGLSPGLLPPPWLSLWLSI